MKLSRANQGRHHRRAGFTITELMIAVAVLIVVILAASRIFQTAGRVASVGEASNNLLQEAASIERQLRTDIANLAREGFFAIQSVSVRNDINGIGTLLNPNLPPDARVRADQLVFFTNGVESSVNYRMGAGENRKGQGTSARIYYGHAFQCPEAGGATGSIAIDPDPAAQLLTPWWSGPAAYNRYNMTSDYALAGAQGNIDSTQPIAREWILARHQVMLVDDGGQADIYLGQIQTGRTLSSAEVINGRVDAVSQRISAENSTVESVRREVTGNQRSVQEQRDYIVDNYLFYPRAERRSPSMSRVDQALTNSVISSACSSFKVEWCYAPGVGSVPFPAGGSISGVHQTGPGTPVPQREDIQWFGLPEWDPSTDNFVGDVLAYKAYNRQAPTIFEENIENPPVAIAGGDPLHVYNAVFGFNQDKPFLNPFGNLPDRVGAPANIDILAGYTPWPTAIRVTMTLHDPRGVLENGREFQFIIKLPERVN